MKKKITYILLCSLMLTFAACEEFTDITPKGKNMLQRVTDLDQVLNYRYYGAAYNASQLSELINDIYPQITNIPNLITNPTKTLSSVRVTWDEETGRTELTVQDYLYTGFYDAIGKVANPVLLMVDAAEGDRELAQRLKAEAYVIRAYMHYLAVNVFAKAYNPATAATDGGVPYVKENDLLSVPSTKYTVQEVYDFILADLEAAFALNSLPDVSANLMRVSLPFAYAVEAKVRMSMHDYSGALQAAEKSLTINSAIYDHRPYIAGNFTRLEAQCPEDLFFASYGYLLLIGLTPELTASFEPGSIFYYSITNGPYAIYNLGPIYHGLPVDVVMMLTAFCSGGGLTTVDMYLTKAECLIRSGKIAEAMAILNDIRTYRIDPAVYAPLTATNTADAFAALKRLSRTENFYGCKNFINLKRWNTEDAYKDTLTKTISWTAASGPASYTYTLRPESPLWIFPFPQNATSFNPNLEQNY
ncbi:MAG: RagB/SusD family nutrient uptake outer membrane protein [Dysgonamonadaceae bacterium]|jgi:hypothetical protein|nr:RagB/SusD family nutrient uptake outer membrane protein [Dysgonamonadaceae bacterium]